MKAIEFTEAEFGTTHAKKIGKELRAAGYKQLGSGADATVWAKDDGYVIKIIMPEDSNSQAVQVFQKFYEVSKQYSDVECLPRFHEVNVIDVDGKEYTQIEMERLQELEMGSASWAMTWMLSDYAKDNVPWNTVLSEIANTDAWETFPDKLKVKMADYVREISQNSKLNSMYSKLYATMKTLYQTGNINKFGWDLHTKNVMQRGNGQLVIIDPWFTLGAESA
jgi:hypothetical protein